MTSLENTSVIVLFSIVFVLAIAEMYFSYLNNKNLYKGRDTFTNLYLMTFALILNLAMKTATLLILNFGYQYRIVEIHNIWAYWILLIVLQDFLYWFLHTTGHYVRLFWAMHVTHHSSEFFNLTTGFRSTVFEPVYRSFFYLPLAFLGFTALDIMFAYLITQVYGNLVHTQSIGKLHPIIEYIFVTPSHHRVHHARNVRYLDKNMGMLLIIWDRMFGTFQEELARDKVEYGLTTPLQKTDAMHVVFHEFKALAADIREAPSMLSKIQYVIKPPGWSHDGRTQIAKVLQKELNDNEKDEKRNPF